MLSRLVITFLSRSKHLLISWLQSPSAVILEPRKIKSATVSTVSQSICHVGKLPPKISPGHCLMVCCPSDPLQLSESWWNYYIWEVCSENQWDALKTATLAASIGQQKEPNFSLQQCLTTCCTTNALKVEPIGLQGFASFAIFIWPLANWLPLLQAPPQLFAGKMLPQSAGRRKCFPRFLCYRNKLTFHWQKCVDCKFVQRWVLTRVLVVFISQCCSYPKSI